MLRNSRARPAAVVSQNARRRIVGIENRRHAPPPPGVTIASFAQREEAARYLEQLHAWGYPPDEARIVTEVPDRATGRAATATTVLAGTLAGAVAASVVTRAGPPVTARTARVAGGASLGATLALAGRTLRERARGSTDRQFAAARFRVVVPLAIDSIDAIVGRAAARHR